MEPSLSSQPALSLIVPAYNEERRLPTFTAAVRRYLDQAFKGEYEVIVVDDGSRDGTLLALNGMRAGWRQLRVVTHPQNIGKGAAIRSGMQIANGSIWLFADADGATPIEQEAALRDAVVAGADIAVGSRIAAGDRVERSRSFVRRLSGAAFRRLCREVFCLEVSDTQCGFKMFSKTIGRRLLLAGQECGYLFDIELLALAKGWGCRVAEVPVSWHEMSGSKVRLGRDSLRVLWELQRLHRRLQARGREI